MKDKQVSSMGKKIEVSITIDTMIELLKSSILTTEIDRITIQIKCPDIYEILDKNKEVELLKLKKLLEKIEKLNLTN